MKRYRWVLGCCLLLSIGVLWAEDKSDLRALQQEAAQNRNLDSYVKVCKLLYQTEEDPDLLLSYADSIHQLAIDSGKPEIFIEYYIWLSEGYFIKGDFEQGYALKRKAIGLAEKAGLRFTIAQACCDMGYYCNADARYDSARYYFHKGLVAGEGLPGAEEACRTILTNYASSFLFEGQTDSALVYTIRASERSAADKDTAMLIENLNQLGTIYRRKKNLEDCIANFEEALHLCELCGNYNTVAFIYGNIATAYCDWDRPEDAISFSEKALKYALKTDNKRRIGTCYVNLGAILVRMEKMRTEGIDTLLKAIPFLEQVNDRRQLCNAYNYLVNAYRLDGNLDMAMQYLQKLDKLAHEMQTDIERFKYYQAKAALLQESKNYADAIVYYRKIVDMLRSGYKDARDYEHYRKLSECYLAVNNLSLAYNYMTQAYALRDSVFQTEETDQLSEYSVKYRTKEKEFEIVSLRREQLEQETYMLRHRIIVGSVISLLGILLLGSLYARQRQRARIALLANAACEKEREFLELQKETEQRLTRKYIDGLESERERMATELHDDVCNSLLALEMNIRTISGEESSDLSEQLGLLSNTRERLRTLSHELMPPAFQYATLDEMLGDYVLHLALPEGMYAEYHSTENVDWNIIPKAVGFECYRIVQEAVSNAVKYASSARIQVKLALENKNLSILVTDDGKGFDMSKKTKGIGLHTIWQRAETIGAKVELISAPGEGTRLRVNVII